MSQLSTHRPAALACALALLAGPARGQAHVPPRALEREAGLARALQGDPRTLRERLERLEPRPVAGLLALALGRRLPGSGDATLPADEVAASAFEVLRGTGFRPLQPHLLELADEPASWVERSVAMSLLEGARQPEAVHVLIALGTAPDGSPAPRAARERYAATLRRVLANDAHNVEALQAVLARVPAGLVTTTLDALDDQPPQAVLAVVAATLGRVTALDSLLLVYAVRHAGRAQPPFAAEVHERVRAYLSNADPGLRTLAAQACGALRDDEAVPDLIDLLDGSQPEARAAARQALVAITGLGFPESAEAWERWFQGELEWWRAGAPEALERLRSGQPSEASAALNELAAHRLYQGQLAHALGEMLPGLPEARALAVCGVLLHLRTPLAREALARGERHPSEAVRERAATALEALGRPPPGRPR